MSDVPVEMVERVTNPKSGRVACLPFKSNSLEIRREGGIAIPNNRETLTPLKVLYGAENFYPGDVVYVQGDQCASEWGKRVYTIDAGTEHAKKFILVPIEQVFILERR